MQSEMNSLNLTVAGSKQQLIIAQIKNSSIIPNAQINIRLRGQTCRQTCNKFELS